MDQSLEIPNFMKRTKEPPMTQKQEKKTRQKTIWIKVYLPYVDTKQSTKKNWRIWI